MHSTQPSSTPAVTSLRASRIVYTAVWILVAMGAILSEAEILPIGYLAVTAEGLYAFQVICVFLTLVVPWLTLKWFHFSFVRDALAARPESRNRWNLYRIGLIGGFLFFNLAVYYALLTTTTPLFGLFIGLLAYVFCVPKQAE